MSSPSFSAIVTLESALALLSEKLENLRAAGSIEVAQLGEQVRMAAESAGKVRESVLSKTPEASPQSRQELDALVEKIRETLEARRVEQQQSRLLALAAELECGTVVHRRALRVSEVNQLREQAVAELRPMRNRKRRQRYPVQQRHNGSSGRVACRSRTMLNVCSFCKVGLHVSTIS